MEKRRTSFLTRIAELTWREAPPQPPKRARSDVRKVNPRSKRIGDALRRWLEEEL